MTKQFVIGQTYSARSICDYDTIYSFTIVARTAKMITFRQYGETRRRGVYIRALATRPAMTVRSAAHGVASPHASANPTASAARPCPTSSGPTLTCRRTDWCATPSKWRRWRGPKRGGRKKPTNAPPTTLSQTHRRAGTATLRVVEKSS
jgi:hypothetical protein